jgi:protein-S-isoprenylcysteine O-methyltransferase Ste14
MYLFLILLLLGFALAGASVFTALYSRWWGERGGQIATSMLRNFLAIPLWMFGFTMAWLQPSRLLLSPSKASAILAWLLIIVGSIPVVWGHLALGWRTHFPSTRDTLVRDGLYGRVRHPIYAGGMLMFIGLALLKPTSALLLACALGFVWLIVQAQLEEIDLLQRMPGYREYIKEVPRFVPRLRKSEATAPSVRAPFRRRQKHE